MLYKGMTIIDGTGASPQPNMAVITEGTRIALVFPAKQLEIMRLAPMEVVEAAGLIALPAVPVEELEREVRRGTRLATAVAAIAGGRIIAVGKPADMIFVRGDPAENLGLLRRPAFVVRGGVRQTGA